MATQWQQQPQPPPQPPHYQVPSQYPQQSPLYQQPGPYTQREQYQWPRQYAQPQQHQPNQQLRPQQQGYSGYQQQYAPQQYPSQHPSPAQHSAPQYGAHQQHPQQRTNPTYAQSSSQVAVSQACYNCASPDHFAQDCPEPKREVPAGALDPVRFANPLKRPRPGSTVVTRYQSAPHNQVYASPQGYGQAPPSQPSQEQPGYPQYQEQQSPATPVTTISAQSPAHQQYVQQQWQQYYQYQRAYQQGSYNRHGVNYQQQQYPNPSTPAVRYAHGSHQPDQASFRIHQNGTNAQIYQSQPLQTQQHQQPIASAAPNQHNQRISQNFAVSEALGRAQQNGSSMQPHSDFTGTCQDKDANAEAGEDDLYLLDVPSLPPSPSRAGTKTYLPNTLVSPPVNLLCMPLPANFVVADTLYPIAPPAPEMDGRCQSKYFRDNNLAVLNENIRESKYWKDHKDDPTFSEFPDDDNVVSLDELLSKLKERHVNGDLNEDPMRKSRSLSRSVSVRQNSGDFRGDLEILERDLAKLKAEMERKEMLARSKYSSPTRSAAPENPTVKKVVIKEEETSPQSALSEKVPMSAQETEDVLASLGVTGPPKPIMRPYRASSYGSPSDNMRSCSISSSKAEISHPPKDHPTNGSPQYYQGYAPPPPPPPYHQQSLPEGSNGSPLSAPPLYVNSYNYSANDGENGNGSFEYGPNAQCTSPIELHSERSGNRKRSYTRRNSISDEEETPARRQEDDITPKHKRRAPKIQEAYGRRW